MIAIFGGTAVVHAQDSKPSAQPKPRVERVGLTPESVGAGWEADLGTDANLVAVQWDGDNAASYTFASRRWRSGTRRRRDRPRRHAARH